MKIIALHNNHILSNTAKPEDEYGCVCNKCGTVFTFKLSETLVPRCINTKLKDINVECPNCENIINLTLCYEFKTYEDKMDFEQHFSCSK